MRTRAQERAEQKLESQPGAQLPPPITDTKAAVPGMMQSPSQDSPMGVDSDTEAEFAANGNGRPAHPRLSRRSSHHTLSHHAAGSARASGISSQDIRRAFASRRPWITTAQATDGDSGDDIPQIDYGAATPDPPPESTPGTREPSAAHTPNAQAASMPASPSSLFKRLRTASFSPFASMRRGSRIFTANGGQEPPVQMGSSESSSDDDDLSIMSRRTWRPNQSRESYSDEDGEYDANESQDH